MAVFEFFTRATRTGVIAPDLRLRGRCGSRLLCLTGKRLIVLRMLVLHVMHIGMRRGFGNILLATNLNRKHNPCHLTTHGVQQIFKQFKGFPFVLLLGVLLGIATQMDALAQMIQRCQMLSPV